MPSSGHADVDNHNVLFGFLLVHTRVLDSMYHIEALYSSAEDCVFVVKPRLEQKVGQPAAPSSKDWPQGVVAAVANSQFSPW